ncbi:MAG: hypothetical protein ACJA02_000906 [Myxococcota bacterium]
MKYLQENKSFEQEKEVKEDPNGSGFFERVFGKKEVNIEEEIAMKYDKTADDAE